MDRGRDDGAGIQIDRMLGLVGQPGAAVLHLGDPGLGVAWRGPVRVGQPLALPACDPAGSGRPPSVSRCRFPWPAARASRDSLRRCRGGRWLRSAALASIVEASTPIRSPWISPCSARRCSTQANTASCTSSGRRERVLLSQEWSGTCSVVPSRRNSRKRQAVGAAPFQAALAVDPLEVADQVHAEVAARRQRRPALLAGVVGARTAARRSRRTQPRSAPPAGGRRRRAPASAAAPPSRPSDPPAARPAAPAPCSPPHRHDRSESAKPDFVNGLLSCSLSSTWSRLYGPAFRRMECLRDVQGGRQGWRRRLSKLSCAGWLPHDRGCVSGLPRSKCEPRHRAGS